MPDKLPSAVKTGSVQARFADGSERTLPIHGINQMQVLRFFDELGIKSFDALKLNGSEPSLETIRFIERTTAAALTSEQDAWTVQRIQDSFSDMVEVTKIFLACLSLSNLPQASSTTPEKSRKLTPYR